MALTLSDSDYKAVMSGLRWNPDTNVWEFADTATAILSAVLTKALEESTPIIRIDSPVSPKPKRKRTKITTGKKS